MKRKNTYVSSFSSFLLDGKSSSAFLGLLLLSKKKIPSPSQLRRPLLFDTRSQPGEITNEPDDASPEPSAKMPAVGGGTAFDSNHEPSLEQPYGSGTDVNAAAASPPLSSAA